ncbi:Protein phosphatase PTC7-like protein fig [Bienertia sinuspersici]
MEANTNKVEAWVGELTKLRKKLSLRAHNPIAKNAINNNNNNGYSSNKQDDIPSSSATSYYCSPTETSTLSESTMCLLLDRFVPC